MFKSCFFRNKTLSPPPRFSSAFPREGILFFSPKKKLCKNSVRPFVTSVFDVYEMPMEQGKKRNTEFLHYSPAQGIRRHLLSQLYGALNKVFLSSRARARLNESATIAESSIRDTCAGTHKTRDAEKWNSRPPMTSLSRHVRGHVTPATREKRAIWRGGGRLTVNRNEL